MVVGAGPRVPASVPLVCHGPLYPRWGRKSQSGVVWFGVHAVPRIETRRLVNDELVLEEAPVLNAVRNDPVTAT
jgi:hypothetical protein